MYICMHVGTYAGVYINVIVLLSFTLKQKLHICSHVFCIYREESILAATVVVVVV